MDLYQVWDYMPTDLFKILVSKQHLTIPHAQYFTFQVRRAAVWVSDVVCVCLCVHPRPTHACAGVHVQILLALRYLHRANVVHGALTPSEVFLNEVCDLKIGGLWNVRFGALARACHEAWCTCHTQSP